MQDTIVITKEGNHPYHHCPNCYMFMKWAVINQCHPTTNLCEMRANMKQERLEEEESQAGAVMAFKEYGQPLETVTHFKYLRCLLTATYDDCL